MSENTAAINHFAERMKKQLATLPTVMGNELLNFSLDNFKRQAFLGDTFQPWPKRKIIKGKRDSGRAILVQTGRLRRAGRIAKADWSAIVYANDAPQAQAHNDGFRGVVNVKAYQRNKYKSNKAGSGKFTKKGVERMKTVKSISATVNVKAHKMKMNLPRRRFIGKSQYLTARLQRVGLAHLLKAYNNG